MKKFHGSPMSGTRQDVARFFTGRDALVPFPRRDDMNIIADVSRSFVFDNGAFSVWKRGAVLDVPGYLAWIRDWCKHPGFEWALIPDEIEGNETDNDALIDGFKTAGLALYGVPVWHLHESLDRLARLCDEWPTVALGSSGKWASPGTAEWWARMSEAMDAICDEHGRPAARLHGLRMLNTRIFTKLPLASADSTNATMNCGAVKRFGMYPAPTAAQRAAVIAERIEVENSACVWQRELA